MACVLPWSRRRSGGRHVKDAKICADYPAATGVASSVRRSAREVCDHHRRRSTTTAVGHRRDPTEEGQMGHDPQVESSGSHEDEGTPEKHVMGLLSEHVPLSLIVDLSDPNGPDSADILNSEGVPEDAWWELGSTGDGAEAEAAEQDGEPESTE